MKKLTTKERIVLFWGTVALFAVLFLIGYIETAEWL